MLKTIEELRREVENAVTTVKILDVHTHLYSARFGRLLLWGPDELLTYHYLIAEAMRRAPLPYSEFWGMSKRQQAEYIWKCLFLESSPISEATRGVVTVLSRLGLEVTSRDLSALREYFAQLSAEEYVDLVLAQSGVEKVVMTNNPFDEEEREIWLRGAEKDPRFLAALRLDELLNAYPGAVPRLREWGYEVDDALGGKSVAGVRRFLEHWTERMSPVYLAVSLPPDFAFPENSPRGALLEKCVLPHARERRLPLALMIGVKKLVNPSLRLAGDGVGKADIAVIERLCAGFPENKFLVTMLARENQHELCVAARKFSNLGIFGCWWFLNNPSLIEEITRQRLELLGTAFIPQHSDARVLDQLLYKWEHSRQIIARVLADKYAETFRAGWRSTAAEIRRDVAALFGQNFREFLAR